MTDEQRLPEYQVPDNIAWVDGADFELAEEVVELVELPATEIEEEVTRFLADLKGRGLLVKPGEDPHPAPIHHPANAIPTAPTRSASRKRVALDRSTVDKVRRHVERRTDPSRSRTIWTS